MAEDEYVERVVVFGEGLRDEPVVGGVVDGGIEDSIKPEHAGFLVEFVFDAGTHGNFDDGGEFHGQPFARRNIVPGMNHLGATPSAGQKRAGRIKGDSNALNRAAIRDWEKPETGTGPFESRNGAV